MDKNQIWTISEKRGGGISFRLIKITTLSWMKQGKVEHNKDRKFNEWELMDMNPEWEGTKDLFEIKWKQTSSIEWGR